jgi:hypothetical protein
LFRAKGTTKWTAVALAWSKKRAKCFTFIRFPLTTFEESLSMMCVSRDAYRCEWPHSCATRNHRARITMLLEKNHRIIDHRFSRLGIVVWKMIRRDSTNSCKFPNAFTHSKGSKLDSLWFLSSKGIPQKRENLTLCHAIGPNSWSQQTMPI